jgi:hypothetical protein
MKYVMMEVKLSENCIQKYPVIFPNNLVHSDMKEMYQALLEKTLPGLEVRLGSAGDVVLQKLRCAGSSSTLGVSSHPEDSDTLKMYDYFSGLEDVVGNVQPLNEELQSPEDKGKVLRILFDESD